MPAAKIIKTDIINSIYEKTDLSRNEVHLAVDLFINEIKEALLRRQSIELRGFGTFKVKTRKARSKARNPKTGESIEISSHGVVCFRSGQELKQAVYNLTDDEKPEE